MSYEITIQIRDSLGNPTGKTKTYVSDKSDEIADFFNRNHIRKPHDKSKKNKENKK
jgi:hypothetical protein